MSKAGSKEKEKTIPDKIKKFFWRHPKTPPPNNPYARYEEFFLTQDVMKEIGPDSPMSVRVRALRELQDVVSAKRLEENAVEALWQATEDLLRPNADKESRQVLLVLLRHLIQGQYEKLGIIRAKFFSFIQKHKCSDDFLLRFELLKTLTENGKDLLYFEEEMGPFILDWMSEVLMSSKATEFLSLLENVIKFNSAFLEQKTLEDLISNTCVYICCTNSEENILQCLTVLDVFVCYSCLPSESLNILIYTLCRTVNVEKFCLISWKLMKNLLGTHLGHSTVCRLCKILQNDQSVDDFSLLRGSVFFLSMGLWGQTRVAALQHHPPIMVLPSFQQCLRYKDANVATEVSLAILRLVQNNGTELYSITWDLVMKILEELFLASEVSKLPLLSSTVNQTLISIDELYQATNFGGSEDRLFMLFEKCSAKLPESLVLQLMQYKVRTISPLKALWLTNLNWFVDKFFRQESRTNIRTKAIEMLSTIIDINKKVYEEDMIDKIVLPLMKNVECETDSKVCNVAVQLLVSLARDCTSKRCIDILELILKVINKPLEQSSKVDDVCNILHENELEPVTSAALGLIEIFKVKMFRLPSNHAVKAFQILTAHIQTHYHGPIIIHKNTIRLMILKCFLQLRCNMLNQIGMIDSDRKISYSSYLLCASTEKAASTVASPPVSSPTPFPKIPCALTYLAPDKALQAIIMSLKKDTDWEVLVMVLDELPNLLQNQKLILSGENVPANLCSILCSMVSDRTLGLPESLRNAPPNFNRADFHSHVLPVLAALVSYHKHLDGTLQCRLVKCLEFGFVTKCARVCIIALTLCILEIRDTLYKLLPEVLLNLSKISATVGISIPILEFLSSLIRLPKLYASFVEDQYMSIFAIALPYINPLKFNHYTVALAYHVIAMWFLKCRLPFRRDFVKFIIQGLHSNVLVPIEETEMAGTIFSSVDDSNIRRRACSMNEQALAARKRDRGSIMSGSSIPTTEPRPIFSQQMKELNLELIETCVDLMARYTFAACSALPKRFPASNFLLAGGQSNTWLLGNTLITVTTSGCSSKVMKQGLCDKCLSLCKGEKGTSDPSPLRRRHRSAIQRSVTSEVHFPQAQTKDDLQLQKPTSTYRSTDASTLMLKPLTGSSKNPQELETQNLDKLLFGFQDESAATVMPPLSHLCNCWCQGWAEILVRRPTGNVSWMMRVQNQPHLLESASDFPLADISTLLLPSHANQENNFEDAYKVLVNHRRIDSESLEETEYEKIFQEHFEKGDEPISHSARFFNEENGRHEKYLRSISKDVFSIEEIKKNLLTGSSAQPAYRVAPTGKLLKVKSTLQKVNSNPELFECAEMMTLPDDTRKDRVQSDAAILAKAAKKRAERRPLLKSAEGFPRVHLSKEAKTEFASGFKAATFLQHVQKFDQDDVDSAAKREPETPTAESLAKDVNAKPANRKLTSSESDPTSARKTTLAEPDKPLQSSLRRHSSTREERREDRIDGLRLLRRGSEKGVRFDPKTKSPPHSPGTTKEELALFKPANFRDRGHTISTANPAYRQRKQNDESKRQKDLYRSGINPSFVFLQLYQGSCFGSTSDVPLLLPKSAVFDRSLSCFDLIPPYETHKIGVVYVGKDQVNNEAAILSNAYGSMRYVEFLRGLGQLICLQEINPQTTYIGGLAQNGEDGKFAYIWQDDVMQVIFHVATLMPCKQSDPSCVSKKLHIGNDFVTIVYNDSGEDFNIQTIKGQFMYACVVIHPLDYGSNSVVIKTKPDLIELIGHSSPKIISNQNLPVLARQLALHANLASLIFQSQKAASCNPYASNWLERLRDLKRLQKKLKDEKAKSHHESVMTTENPMPTLQVRSDSIKDFTDYV